MLSQPTTTGTRGKKNFDVIPVHYITSEITATGSQLKVVRVVTQAPLLDQLKNQIF